MRAKERGKLQRKLDEEMRPFRRAGLDLSPTNGLLRAVRTALKIPIEDIAERMGVTRSVVFDLEGRELTNGATLRSMSRMAEAMDCKMVYGIVPKWGLTLERLAEERLWRSTLAKRKSIVAAKSEPETVKSAEEEREISLGEFADHLLGLR
jgi:predicted DNA-binding mobile mystery protein A